MYIFLLILLILTSLVLIAAVLLQAGKGGGVAASFGGASTSSDSLIGTRQAGNLLTKLSWWGGGVFIFLAFVLQLMSVRTRAPKSVLDQPLGTAPAPVTAPPASKKGSAPALPVVPLRKDGKSPAPKTK
ncbi:MAG: preprotein translocase subunit SecG [Gemmatimonadaceae bacterium]